MESVDNVFDYVIPYIHDRNDRSSISLICRKWYELDSITRKHLTVHSHYSPPPSRVHQRFPFIQSLTIKGISYGLVDFPQNSGIDFSITPWIKEIAVKFNCLKALHIRGMVVYDSDLELLARTRGKDLRVLKICKCRPFEEDGLMHVGKHCNQLRTLCLERNAHSLFTEHGKWLHELALHNTSLETFHYRYDSMFLPDEYDVKGLALLIKSCSKSLVSLKVNPGYLEDALSHSVKLENLVGDALSHAVKLENLVGASTSCDQYRENFRHPPNLRCLGLSGSQTYSCLVYTIGTQLRELNVSSVDHDGSVCNHIFIISCPNLEVLDIEDACGDRGLQYIGYFCKKLRKLTYMNGLGTHVGLIAVAQGCSNLEYLHINSNVSNEALECIGTNLKNLRNFYIRTVKEEEEEEDIKTDLPLDNGIRAMLIGCVNLERLYMCFSLGDLTDVGLGYVGKYGNNLRFLCLDCIGESDEGLIKLSEGCPKLRKLGMTSCVGFYKLLTIK